MNTVLTLKIADIMSRSICSVSDDATLSDAAKIMAKEGISSLLVMSGQTLLGIITEWDLLRMLHTPANVEIPVVEVMSSPVISVSPDTDFDEAFSIALNHHVRHLVVVDEVRAVIGIVSDTDFRTHLDMNALRQLDKLTVIMDHDLPILAADSNLTDASRLMLRDHSSYILVVENYYPVGILTERDIPKLMANVMPEVSRNLTLREVMQKPVLTVPSDTSVFELINFMQTQQLRHVVVVDEVGKTLGMVTQRKLLERLLVFLMHDKELHLKRIQRRSNELLNLAVEASKLSFWEFYPSTQELRDSGTLLQEMGLVSANEVSPIALQEWIERVHLDDRSLFMAGWEAIRQSGNQVIKESN
jgi:two-component system sensor histidine kinase/response regulator